MDAELSIFLMGFGKGRGGGGVCLPQMHIWAMCVCICVSQLVICAAPSTSADIDSARSLSWPQAHQHTDKHIFVYLAERTVVSKNCMNLTSLLFSCQNPTLLPLSWKKKDWLQWADKNHSSFLFVLKKKPPKTKIVFMLADFLISESDIQACERPKMGWNDFHWQHILSESHSKWAGPEVRNWWEVLTSRIVKNGCTCESSFGFSHE